MLKMAAIRGDQILVQLFLSMEIDAINIKDDAGWTPLAYSAAFKYEEVVVTLLKGGAIPSLRTNDGFTVQELVKQKLARLTAGETDAKKQYHQILRHLDNPPQLDWNVSEAAWHDTDTLLLDNSPEKKVCECFNINTRFYNNLAQTEVSVWDFIYDTSKDSDHVGKRVKYLPRSESTWQWLHLPANNVC
jgi:hypothetical protein